MAESIRITLVALFFFRMCMGGGLVGDMGFETLLRLDVLAILHSVLSLLEYMKHSKGSVLSTFKSGCVPKVRARVVQLSLRWRLTGFKTAL